MKKNKETKQTNKKTVTFLDRNQGYNFGGALEELASIKEELELWLKMQKNDLPSSEDVMFLGDKKEWSPEGFESQIQKLGFKKSKIELYLKNIENNQDDQLQYANLVRTCLHS